MAGETWRLSITIEPQAQLVFHNIHINDTNDIAAGEINAGISGQVTSTTTLYANGSYQSRFEAAASPTQERSGCG